MGSDSDGDDYESLANLLAVAMAAFASTRNTILVLVEDEDNRRLRHVGARDRRERRKKQPSLQRGRTTLVA